MDLYAFAQSLETNRLPRFRQDACDFLDLRRVVASEESADLLVFLVLLDYLDPLTSNVYSLMSNVLSVGLGCFLGGILRYLLSLWLGTPNLQHFPWATLAANLIGCLLLGLFNGWFLQQHPSPFLRLFLTVGLCGGFTTFSTFTNDLFLLGRNQQWEIALLYGIVSFIGGILCLGLGYKLTSL